MENASIGVRREGNNLILKHVYIERRVRPLNLYINEYSFEEAARAIIDYGEAIKDLAKTNIFPGDLLLKNFGVTQHNRVIFYDYDEVSLVTDCNFRDIPQSNSIEDEMQADTWYYVGEHDIFPEEFIRFLSMNDQLRTEFMKYHQDLLTSKYWQRVKKSTPKRSGIISDTLYVAFITTKKHFKRSSDEIIRHYLKFQYILHIK